MHALSLIRNLDFLSNEVQLTINKGDIRLKTFFGGILSLLSVISIVSFCLFFFIKFIQNSDTFVTISSESSQYSNLTNSNNYPFLIRLTDKQNQPFSNPNEIYSIALKYWYGGSNTSLEMIGQKTVDITIEPCDINKHFGNYKHLFSNMSDLNTFHCSVPRPFNETIYGRYGDVFPFGYYHFYVTMCMNNTKCKKMSDLQKITQNVYLDFRTVDFSINSFQKSAKVETIRTDRHMLSSTVYKRIWVYLNEIQYVTDTGLFFNSESTEYFSKFDSMRYDVDLRDIFTGTIPGTFVTMTVLNTGNVSKYNRKYLKLQDYLASVGGIAKFVQVFAFMLNYMFSQNSYYLKLIDSLQIMQVLTKKTGVKDKINNNMLYNNMNAFSAISVEPKIEVNDSKENVTKKTYKQNLFIDDRLYKWYYRMLPISVFPKKEGDIIRKCIDKVNSRLNVVTILTQIEDNFIYIKELIGEDKGNSYCDEKMDKRHYKISLKKSLTKIPLKSYKLTSLNSTEKELKKPNYNI